MMVHVLRYTRGYFARVTVINGTVIIAIAAKPDVTLEIPIEVTLDPDADFIVQVGIYAVKVKAHIREVEFIVQGLNPNINVVWIVDRETFNTQWTRSFLPVEVPTRENEIDGQPE